MNILRYEENGVEFFTLQATGESGMSQSGLARLCGVGRKAVDNLLDRLSTSFCPDFLKPLRDMDLTLSKSVHEFNNATILKDTVCAVILEWYAFESQRTTETARESFRAFAKVGIRTWIQDITGWENPLNPPRQTQVESLVQPPSLEEINELVSQVATLKHHLLVALKHRHAIHNIVEQPRIVDLSLNCVVHTAVHQQGEKLNQALNQVEAIEATIANLSTFFETASQGQCFWQTVEELTQTIADLTEENQRSQQRLEQQQSRLQVLHQRRSTCPSLALSTTKEADLLQNRIQEITDQLMSQKKRTGGKRAKRTCTLQATILARYEMGETLEEIAKDLGRPYETVKTYVKLARKGLSQNPQFSFYS